ncbi:MAG: hypothetical protein PHW86_05110 [Candidatus Bipolaricaulis sp.]|nr:hypothetical protein [Candidatus Bipolaricaulis sp.]
MRRERTSRNELRQTRASDRSGGHAARRARHALWAKNTLYHVVLLSLLLRAALAGGARARRHAVRLPLRGTGGGDLS